MEPPLFYAPGITSGDSDFSLPPDEAKHALSVLRLKPGDPVLLVDGIGTGFRATIEKAGRAKCDVRVYHEIRNFGEPSVRLTLAAGLSTGYKFDTVIQKGTELGVARFVPLLTRKSKVSIDDARKARNRVNRWTKVATAAMKQCRRSFLPEVALPTAITDFFQQTDPEDMAIVFDGSDGGIPIAQVDFSGQPKRVILAVGPESGFAREELEEAEAFGFVRVSLGKRVLRTETAGPVAAAVVMDRLGEFR